MRFGSEAAGKSEVMNQSSSAAANVIRGSVVILLTTLLAKLASFLSEAILAAYLGTTDISDAYYMVASVQALFYPMLSIGIWKVFLPLYKERITHGLMEEAAKLTNKAITFFTCFSLIAVGLLILLAGPVVTLVAPGFTGEKQKLCKELVQISAPMYIFILASAIYASMLQSHNKFFASQIREVVSHIPTILTALLFYRRFGVQSLAIALIAGGFLRLLISLPFVDWGYRYCPDFRFFGKEFRHMLERLPSAMLSEGIVQLNTLIDKMMASTLPSGTISGLNYGHRLVNVFGGLISSSVGTAMYPQMVELIVKDQKEALKGLLTKIFNLFLILIIPVSLACVMFRREVVTVVYQRGSFDEASTALTAGIFALYSLGLLFNATNGILSNLFYGHGNTKTPMYICLANLVINVAMNYFMIQVWGVNGLALATFLSAAISFVIRLLLARRYVRLDRRHILLAVGKVLIASAFAVGIPWWIIPRLGLGVLLTLLLSMIVGVSIYFAALHLLRVEELHDVAALIKKRLGRRK